MTSQYLEVHQARTHPPSPYEMKLAAAIEEIFGRGDHDVASFVAGLNAAGLRAPDGGEWDADRLTEQFESLGA